MGDYINYQGSKLGLALLEFADAKPVGGVGLQYLTVYGANLYGYKGPYERSVEFIEKNNADIMSMDRVFMRSSKNYHLFAA